jgi:putative transposase
VRVGTVHVGPGAIIKLGDEPFCVKRWESSASVLGRSLRTLEDRIITLSEISESASKCQDGPQIDLSAIDDDEWDIAIEKYRLLSPLLHDPDRKTEDVRAVADGLLVSTMTVYRWIKKLETHATVSCLLRKRREDAGTTRLPAAVAKILKDVIPDEYLSDQKKSPAKVFKEVLRRCRNENLKPPSKGAVLRRLYAILPEVRERSREGRNASLNKRPARGSAPGIDHVHAVWQIDHTLVDLVLVDGEDRIPIGRPWITLAMDVFSRTVVGWYISLDPPGMLGTGICISNAILPKDALLAKLGVSHSWPCQGKPRKIHADNAKEFRGNTLRNACQEHGVDLTYRKVKKPNYGAHIERMLGTLLLEIHSLAGTTFSNPQEKGEYDSDAHASMTLEGFELWLANLILGEYHNRPHSELKCSPARKYNDGIFGDDTTPGIGLLPIAADPEKLRIDFLPMEERTIQPDGVTLDWIKYHSPVLDRWIGASDPESRRKSRKFIFRRDPRNISFLYFWDADQRRYFTIHYRDTSRPAISLWELKAIQRFLADRGKSEIDEDRIFLALNEMRRIEDESKSLTRQMRRGRERRRKHRELAPTPPASAAEELEKSTSKEIEKTAEAFDPANIKLISEVERL